MTARTRTRKIILYCMITITGLSLVRKIKFYCEYVKQEKCIYFMLDTRILLFFTFFFECKNLIFYSLHILVFK